MVDIQASTERLRHVVQVSPKVLQDHCIERVTCCAQIELAPILLMIQDTGQVEKAASYRPKSAIAPPRLADVTNCH